MSVSSRWADQSERKPSPSQIRAMSNAVRWDREQIGVTVRPGTYLEHTAVPASRNECTPKGTNCIYQIQRIDKMYQRSRWRCRCQQDAGQVRARGRKKEKRVCLVRFRRLDHRVWWLSCRWTLGKTRPGQFGPPGSGVLRTCAVARENSDYLLLLLLRVCIQNYYVCINL